MSRILVFLFLVGPLLWAAERRVWIGTGGDGIYTATLDEGTGVLSEVTRAAEVKSPGFLVLRPGGEALYAAVRGPKGAGEVVGFRVGKEGVLSEICRQASGGAGPCHVDLTPDGKVLLVANYGSGSVASYRVAGDGSFGPAASVHQHEGSSVDPRRQQRPHAHGFFSAPGGSMAYAPDLGIDAVVCYRVDPESGKTARVGEWAMAPGTGPRHLKIGPEGRRLYVLGELSHTVVVGTLGEGEGPRTRQVIPVLPDGAESAGMTCSEIRVHPRGRFLYTAIRDLQGEGRARLTTFRILPDGLLERVQVVPAECKIPRNFNLSPDGKWLLVAGQSSDTIAVFRVGEDGLLEFTGKKISAPKPMCVVFGDVVKN